MLAFEEGKTAAQQGVEPIENPYPMYSQEGDAWGAGWLVGLDPQLWGEYAARYKSESTHN